MNFLNEIYTFIVKTSNYESFFSDLIVGVLLVFIFFIYREYISPLPNISGKWYVRTTTKETARNPFKDMILEYVVIIIQDGHNLEGTTEKIYEKSVNGEIEYEGKNRVQGLLKGYVEKNYLKKDKIKIHIIEDGNLRKSTIYYELNKNCSSKLEGVFDTTAGDSKGIVTWQKESFS